MALRLALSCLLAFSVVLAEESNSEFETYSRSVSYYDDVIVQCASKDDKLTKWVMAQSGVDMWRIDSSSTVDMRMSQALYLAVRDSVPNCHLLVDSVEVLVQEAEKNMFSGKRYVSEDFAVKEVDDGVSKYFKSFFTLTMKNSYDDWFSSYHNLEAIKDWYYTLAQENSELVTYVPSIGKTVEGRDLFAVHITASLHPERGRFYIQCLIHAREWISGSTCMYVANHLVSNYNKDAQVTEILNNLEFVIVPVVNPDGYAFSWNEDRLWRKNRAKYPSAECTGVDLNRNFLTAWGMEQTQVSSSASSTCSEVYKGPSPASELETQHVMEYFSKNSPILASIDFHSYSQLVLRPWACTFENTPDEERMSQLGQEMAGAIQKVGGKSYTSEKSMSLYQACGVATDWFYEGDGTESNKGFRTIAFTIELRDKGSYGFLLPAEEIKPTGEEGVAAVMSLAKEILKHPLRINDKKSTHK